MITEIENNPDMMNEGQTFEQCGAAKGDSLFQSKFAHEIYTRANPTANTRVTVPILWDKKTSTIVSNESSDLSEINIGLMIFYLF